MLDTLRQRVYKEINQDVVFVVDHFKVSKGNRNGDYAWFSGSAQRKDGKVIVFPEVEWEYDCCHVGALFIKKGSVWHTVMYGAFSTDVWQMGIASDYPDAPKGIFTEEALIE